MCGFSLAYFGSTAVGNTALPVAIGAAGGAASLAAAFVSFAGLASAAGGGGAAGAAGAAAVVPSPHWALRKSFHFWPPSVPASLACLYLALHSCMVSAWAGAAANVARPRTANAANDEAANDVVDSDEPINDLT